MLPLFRKHEVWFFLVLIVVANTLFVSGIVFEILPQRLYSYGRFALLGLLLLGIVTLARGWSGLDDLLRPMLEWRRSLGWYLFALLWNPGICLAILLGRHALGLEAPEIAAKLTFIVRPDVLSVLFVSSFVGEMVWISYSVRRLTDKFTPYVSALVVGTVWTVWWLPMAIYNYGIIPDLPLGALLFNQVGVAAMCTFVYSHTRSGFLVLVMQLMFNSSILVLPITPAVAGVATFWTFAVGYFIAALLLFVVFGPKPLFTRQHEKRVALQV